MKSTQNPTEQHVHVCERWFSIYETVIDLNDVSKYSLTGAEREKQWARTKDASQSFPVGTEIDTCPLKRF